MKIQAMQTVACLTKSEGQRHCKELRKNKSLLINSIAINGNQGDAKSTNEICQPIILGLLTLVFLFIMPVSISGVGEYEITTFDVHSQHDMDFLQA